MIAESNNKGLGENFLGWLKNLHSFRMAEGLIAGEFLLLLTLYDIFMFTDKVPLAGLAALSLFWLARWRLTGKLSIATPLDAPIWGTLALLPISLRVSVDWSLSLPKVYGILLGVAIYYAIIKAFDSLRRLEFAPLMLILLSLAVTALGLVGTDWVIINKLILMPKLHAFLPRLIRTVPRSVTGGIHPNIFGGALTFLIPLLASLLWEDAASYARKDAANPRLLAIIRFLYFMLLILSLLLVFYALLLTQSRGAILGVGVGLYALALWHDRRYLWGIPLAALGLWGAIQVWGGGNLMDFISRLDVLQGGTLAGRLEIWQRAVYIIQNFPFTGIGIGTFDPVAHALYPFILFANSQVPHAHNMLLAVAVDLGLPGLVFYVTLLSGFAISAWKASRVYKGSLRALIVGLACGMLAHQVFGIMDAYMLGTKFGAIMWVFYGFASALYLSRDQLKMQAEGYVTNILVAENSGVSSARRIFKANLAELFCHLRRFLLVYTYWIIFSLVAIALVVQQPFLGLIVAVVEGAILGYICVATFESKTISARTE